MNYDTQALERGIFAMREAQLMDSIDHMESYDGARRGIVRVYVARLDRIVTVSWRRDDDYRPVVEETYYEEVEPFIDKVREYTVDVDLTADEEEFALSQVRR